jgi:hypothetical protein
MAAKGLASRCAPVEREFLDGFNANRGFRHEGTYSLSSARRQSARKDGQPAANEWVLSLHGEASDSPVECNKADS